MYFKNQKYINGILSILVYNLKSYFLFCIYKFSMILVAPPSGYSPVIYVSSVGVKEERAASSGHEEIASGGYLLWNWLPENVVGGSICQIYYPATTSINIKTYPIHQLTALANLRPNRTERSNWYEIHPGGPIDPTTLRQVDWGNGPLCMGLLDNFPSLQFCCRDLQSMYQYLFPEKYWN